jgi:hypothetical protein
MKQDITIPELVSNWQASPIYNQIHFVLLFARMVWKKTCWRERLVITARCASSLLPGALAVILIAASWEIPVALVASTTALVLCISE